MMKHDMLLERVQENSNIRIILFDIDEETKYRSVSDILEMFDMKMSKIRAYCKRRFFQRRGIEAAEFKLLWSSAVKAFKKG